MSFTKKTTALCRRCEGETKQIVRGGRSVALSALLEERGDDGTRLKEFQTDLTYELVECCSCEYIDLRSSRDLSGATGFTVRFHPQLSSRPVPSWRRDLPPVFTPLLDEVYSAVNTDSRILAVTGARMVIDLVIRQKASEVVSFRGGLAALEEAGGLRPGDREFLWGVLVADAERGQAPMRETVSRLMDVVEEMLHAVYVRRNGAKAQLPDSRELVGVTGDFKF